MALKHPPIKFPLGFVPNISKNQEFGADRSAYGGTTHAGIDLQGPRSSDVLGGLKGKVSKQQNFCGGNTLRLDAGDVLKDGRFWSLRYVHLLDYAVAHGATVAAGQKIARLDNTGQCTTGDHLHYEVIVNGTPINPRFVHPELGGSTGVTPIFLMPTWETIVAFWKPGKTTGQALMEFCVEDDHMEHIASELIYAPATSTSLATLMNQHLKAHFGQQPPGEGELIPVVTMADYVDYWHPGKSDDHAKWDWALWHFTHLCMFLEPALPYYNAQAKVYDTHLRKHFGIAESPIWTLASG